MKIRRTLSITMAAMLAACGGGGGGGGSASVTPPLVTTAVTVTFNGPSPTAAEYQAIAGGSWTPFTISSGSATIKVASPYTIAYVCPSITGSFYTFVHVIEPILRAA
jgi:hypothetical protein